LYYIGCFFACKDTQEKCNYQIDKIFVILQIETNIHMGTYTTERIIYIDTLRAFALMGILFVHVA